MALLSTCRMTAFHIWEGYPPQQRLILPHPQLQFEATPFFCRPQYLIEQQTQQPVAFFVALHLPSQPGVLQVESWHVFKPFQAFHQMAYEHIQQLAQQSGCGPILWRSVTLRGHDLFYPTTGFCTSPSNPSNGCPLWLNELGVLVHHLYIWRMGTPTMVPSRYQIQTIDKVTTPPPWPWYAGGERIQVVDISGRVCLQCRIYPNLYPCIRSYGRLPALLYAEDMTVSQCRLQIESPHTFWEPEVLATVCHYLNHQGYLEVEIACSADVVWLLQTPWNGVLQGEIHEWTVSVLR